MRIKIEGDFKADIKVYVGGGLKVGIRAEVLMS